MPLAIRRFPDSILKERTKSVDEIDTRVRALINRMIDLMRRQPHCVGLAAPQIGSSARIAVMDATGHPKVKESRGLIVLVNPLVEQAEGRVVGREGCLSVPDFTGNVARAARVRVTALDQFRVRFTVTLEGFEAVVAQHEIDHLDGMLFLDRVVSPTDVFRRKTYL
ncbi:MAG: peptide deformylase [Candidatus Omnitrophica bacterium CG11_big_fil_rev_8_21_14_0_20_63_9]|nr:MAG: peptide deformylase [Candidatus Omnitrophica bacterium CG11_big_fil_rev_8_21_14_0_20_63_9]